MGSYSSYARLTTVRLACTRFPASEEDHDGQVIVCVVEASKGCSVQGWPRPRVQRLDEAREAERRLNAGYGLTPAPTGIDQVPAGAPEYDFTISFRFTSHGPG